MPLGPPFIVYIQKTPDRSFGATMNDIRAWLDHHKMQPVSFRAGAIGFEIVFNSEDEASFFERDFADLIRPAALL